MQKISMTIRVDVHDVERWKEQAEAAGVGLSEWIRRRLNHGGYNAPVVEQARATKAVHNRFRNIYCKAHHVMDCDYCSKHAGEKGIPE